MLVYAATKPDTLSVQRSTTLAAPTDKLLALISDTRAFDRWNPYALREPAVQLQHEGAASGPGAAYTRNSERVGAGRMEVIESTVPTRVAMRLDFDKPMKTSNRVEFGIEARRNGSKVTWAMTGPMSYPSKLMTTFFDIDQRVGGDFDAGLANLKAMAERA